MPVTLRYLGWSTFEIVLEDRCRIVLDPLIKGGPEQDAPIPAQLEEFDGVDAARQD
jgi:hypothetical protein